MRCHPWRWLWGLVPIVVLGWAAVQIEHARIERDLAARGKEALVQAGLGWAELTFAGRDGALSGEGVEESEPVRAKQIALDTWGVRRVRDFSGLIDKVDRYQWAALRRENRIRLNGLVPNEQMRRQVIGIVKASVPKLEVEDRLRLARGAPPVDIWLGGVGFGIKQLAQLKKGRVDLDVASLSISGEAADVQAYRSVKAALRGGLPPGITLKQDKVTAPVVKPHVWSASRVGNQLTLTGFVPDEQALAAIVDAARYGGSDLKVVDETQPGDGKVKTWTDAAVAVVRALAELEEGSAELRDKELTLTGLAEDEASAEAARKELQRGLTTTFRVTDQLRVRAPAVPIVTPHTTTAEVDGGALTLSGHVPSEETRQSLMTFAASRFAGLQVHDTLQLGAGQQPGWQTCIEAGLDAIARLDNGRASIVDRKLQVVGRTQTESLARTLPDAVHDAAGADCDVEVRLTLEPQPELLSEDPPSSRVAADQPTAAIEPRPGPEAARKAEADTCQDMLQSVMRSGTVQFERGSAELGEASLPTLERLAEVAGQCARVRIEVTGHTDTEGIAQSNQRLSERRAQAVVDFLAEAGVPVARMHAVGYGFARPLVPNTTDENKARNRRIEFNVTAD